MVMIGLVFVGGGFFLIEYVSELYLRFRRLTDIRYHNYKNI